MECSFEKGAARRRSPDSLAGREPFARVAGREFTGVFSHGRFCCRTRLEPGLCYEERGEDRLWVFGSVFSRRAYAETLGRKPFRMYAPELLSLLRDDPDGFHRQVKGSYVMVHWDEKAGRLRMSTDRHNVLPLYYLRRGKRIFVSSSIPHLLRDSGMDLELNVKALASQIIFDYPIGEDHFIQGVKRLLPASVYSFSEEGLRRRQWWRVTEVHHEELMSPEDGLEALMALLFENVELYASDVDKFLLSLTGGFDGRANLSMVRRKREDFMTYSYGMPGSLQLTVPQEISRKLEVPYRPILLEDDFLARYTELSRLSTIFSNGLAPLGFANIPYAFSKLSTFADTAITGLFGSEILRPLNPSIGIQLNRRAFTLFFEPAGPVRREIENYVGDFFAPGSLQQAVVQEGIPAVLREFEEEHVRPYRDYGPVKSSFFFLLEEGLPKYFQQEIQIEREYVTTRFPFFDSDLIDLIYQTPFAGMYNGFLGRSKVKRRKGQLLYAHIMEKYYPELNRIRVDRLYKPIDLLRPFPFNYLLLAWGVGRKNIYMRYKGGNDTFKTRKWAQPTIDDILKGLEDNHGPGLRFREELTERKLASEEHYLTYRHLLAILDFVNHLTH